MDKLDMKERFVKHIERKIILGLIVSTAYLKKVRPQWLEGKFTIISPELHKMAGWCFTHYDEHGKAPLQAIETIYMKYLQDEVGDDPKRKAEAELMDAIVFQIDRDWEKAEGEYDVDFYYQQTMDHFNQLALDDLKYEVETDLDRGEIDKVKTKVSKFKALGQSRWKQTEHIPMRPVYWHWTNIVPKEELVIFAGYKGVGKTTLACSIAALLSSGEAWPDGQENRRARNVIIISAEDSIDSVIVPRLSAAGADMNRCYVPTDIPETTAQACEWIEQLLDDFPHEGRGSAVIVDPITAFMGDKDPNNVALVRSTLRPFVELGHRRKVTVMAIHHLRKSREGEALDLVLGSGGFVHAARVVHFALPDPENRGRNLFVAGANNLSKMHPGYAYQIVPETVKGNISTSKIVWESQPLQLDANQVLDLMRASKSRPKTEEAKTWLRDMLSDGAVPQGAIRKAAEEAGMSWTTVRKAKEELRIKAQQVGRRWIWRKLATH